MIRSCFSMLLSPVAWIMLLGLLFSSCRNDGDIEIILEKKFDLSATEEVSFFDPGGIAVNEKGGIYVADSGNQRIVEFDSQGRFVRSFGRRGEGPGEFVSPWKIIYREGRLYVYDWARNIQIFDPQGEFLSLIKLDGGWFLDMAVDFDGFIYLARWATDEGQFLIDKYSVKGELIARFGKALEGNSRPQSLILNHTKLGIDSNNRLILAFRYVNKIQVYTLSGILEKEFDRPLSYAPREPRHTPDDVKPFDLDGVTGDLTFDGEGRIYISSNRVFSSRGHRIDVLSEEGKFLGFFYSGFLGEELPEESELRRDQDFLIDSSNNFYLLDHGSMTIHVFKLKIRGSGENIHG